jgi:hypothetical protein
MSVTLITTLYNITDSYRLLETKQTILANAENAYISQVIIFFQEYNSYKNDARYLFLLNAPISKKIQVIHIDNHQTYSDLIGYANSKLMGKIVCIANTDILFDQSLSLTNRLTYSKKHLHALARWEAVKDTDTYTICRQTGKNVSWSFDTYIFTSPIECDISSLNIRVGVAGCDTLLVKRLCYDNNFIVTNPCIDIVTYHIDTPIRDRPLSVTSDTSQTYWEYRDYPASWNTCFFESVKNMKPHTVSYEGISITNTFGNKFSSTDLDSMIKSRDIRVIGYSLWGADPTYNIGAIRNAQLALYVYPKWECWFYIHIPTVPQSTISELRKYPNVKIIEKTDFDAPRTWRFEPIDHPHVQVLISRDTDTRILLREKLAVEEWLSTDKSFHIMRDHPHHEMKIMAGLFGTKKLAGVIWRDQIVKYKCDANSRDHDQDFLRDYIYPLVKTSSLVHTNFHIYEGETAKPFPIPHVNGHHAGEYVYADESRSVHHIRALENALRA